MDIQLEPHRKSDIRVRNKCLTWVLEHLNLLELRVRTKEIALFIVDVALSSRAFKLASAELTCVTSVLLAVKLEGDINDNLSSFLEYVFNKLRLALHDIRMEEFALVDLLPHNFSLIPTPSDLMRTLAETTNMRPQFQHSMEKLLENSLVAYAQRGHELEILELCVQPLVLATTSMTGHGKFLSLLNEEVFRMKATFSATTTAPLATGLHSSIEERSSRTFKRVKNV